MADEGAWRHFSTDASGGKYATDPALKRVGWAAVVEVDEEGPIILTERINPETQLDVLLCDAQCAHRATRTTRCCEECNEQPWRQRTGQEDGRPSTTTTRRRRQGLLNRIGLDGREGIANGGIRSRMRKA